MDFSFWQDVASSKCERRADIDGGKEATTNLPEPELEQTRFPIQPRSALTFVISSTATAATWWIGEELRWTITDLGFNPQDEGGNDFLH